MLQPASSMPRWARSDEVECGGVVPHSRVVLAGQAGQVWGNARGEHRARESWDLVG